MPLDSTRVKFFRLGPRPARISLWQKVWVNPSYEKNKLDADWEMYSAIIIIIIIISSRFIGPDWRAIFFVLLFFVARPGRFKKLISLLPARPVGKIISKLPTRPGPMQTCTQNADIRDYLQLKCKISLLFMSLAKKSMFIDLNLYLQIRSLSVHIVLLPTHQYLKKILRN